MIHNKFRCSVFLIFSLMIVSCSGIDGNQIEKVSSDVSTIEDTNIVDDATTEDTDMSVSATSEEVSEDQNGDFYYVELDNECQNIDIGNDGKMDSLLLSYDSGWEKFTLIVNEQKIELISHEDHWDWGECAGAFYIHRTDGDYIITERSGYSNLTDVTLYKWTNDSFEEIIPLLTTR